MKLTILLFILICSSAIAGSTTPFLAKVISYNQERIKVQVDEKNKVISLKDLDHAQIKNLDKWLEKSKVFYLKPGYFEK